MNPGRPQTQAQRDRDRPRQAAGDEAFEPEPEPDDEEEDESFFAEPDESLLLLLPESLDDDSFEELLAGVLDVVVARLSLR